jgi:hypothetical protein
LQRWMPPQKSRQPADPNHARISNDNGDSF